MLSFDHAAPLFEIPGTEQEDRNVGRDVAIVSSPVSNCLITFRKKDRSMSISLLQSGTVSDLLCGGIGLETACCW